MSYGAKTQVWAGLAPSGGSREESTSWLSLASRGCLHSLAHGPFLHLQSASSRTSLVAQWLRTHLPMQGTVVRALVREDATCPGVTKPVHHNY